MKRIFLILVALLSSLSPTWAKTEKTLVLKKQKGLYQLQFYQLGEPIEYQSEFPVALALAFAMTQQVRLDVYLERKSAKNAAIQVVERWEQYGPLLLEVLQRNPSWGIKKANWIAKRPPSYEELFRDVIDPLVAKIDQSDTTTLKNLSARSDDPFSALLRDFPLTFKVKARAKDIPAVILHVN